MVFLQQHDQECRKTEFQRRWGARKLEDNWRRRNKASFSFDDEETKPDEELSDDISSLPTDSIGAESDNDQLKADDPHNVEYYLKQIPSTPEEIQNANDIVMEGLYNMG